MQPLHSRLKITSLRCRSVRSSRDRLVAAALGAVILILFSLIPSLADVLGLPAAVVAQCATQPLADRIIVPRGFSVIEVRPDDGSESQVFAATGMVLSIARSRSTDNLAISVLRRMPGDSYAGADLHLIHGGGQQQLVLRQGPDQEIDAPNVGSPGTELEFAL